MSPLNGETEGADMALNAKAKSELDSFRQRLQGFGKHSHHGHRGDYLRAIDIFIALREEGSDVHPDDVSAWAREQGWDDANAHDLGEMADVVQETMKKLGH
jgi:hypothetical protein